MKKLLLLLATAAATTATSFAQTPAAQTMPAQPGAQKSPDQKAKLQPILVAQRQEMQAMRDKVQTGGRQRGVGQDLKASMAKYDTQLKGILTPEQYTKFSQMKDEQRDKIRERRANGQGMGTPAAQ
jgi:protein CpxP